VEEAIMIDDEPTVVRGSDPDDGATRAVSRDLGATRLRRGPSDDAPRIAGPAAAPAAGRAAYVPADETDHARYGIRREALTVPVTRAPAAPAPRADVAVARRRRPVGTVLVIAAFALAVTAAAVLLALLVIS
jgi:hypothetical protein